MPFLSRTRIMQVGQGSPSAPTPITPVVFQLLSPGVVVETVPDAMALVPAGQRPPQNEWVFYQVQWLVDFTAVPIIRGMQPNLNAKNFLVFDVHFWQSQAARNANPTNPEALNTFIYQFSSSRAQDAITNIRARIDDYLINYTFGGYPRDFRDVNMLTSTDPVYDEFGILAQVAPFNGQAINVSATWRGK